MTSDSRPAQHAEVIVPCPEVGATLEFFTAQLGFRVDAIHPADDPSVAVISGLGIRLRLDQHATGAPGRLRIVCDDVAAVGDGATELTAPNGTVVELVELDPPLVIPPLRPSFVHTRLADTRWGVGRAGMRYRDLIPGRQGGRFIASHIQIPDGGPVQDYVHYHIVQLQMIYCYKGWVRVAYEDQGPPLVMREGDCVLQAPQIRHRVLECSAGLEVIEVGCPASHETRADHDLDLPTAEPRPDRDFHGQRFVHYVAETGDRELWRAAGFETQEFGIAAATGGMAAVRTVRPTGPAPAGTWADDAELLFWFVLHGTASLHRQGGDNEQIIPGDCLVIPGGMRHRLSAASDDLELLEVELPGSAGRRDS